MKTTLILLTIFTGMYFWQRSVTAFDLPTLKGKSIIQIKKILGKPKNETIPTAQQISAGVTGDLIYSKNGYNLDIQFDASTNKVIDFFLDRENSVSDYKIFIKKANLRDIKDFSIKPVKSNKNPSVFTGIIITPK
jgi:hypothetical protein